MGNFVGVDTETNATTTPAIKGPDGNYSPGVPSIAGLLAIRHASSHQPASAIGAPCRCTSLDPPLFCWLKLLGGFTNIDAPRDPGTYMGIAREFDRSHSFMIIIFTKVLCKGFKRFEMLC